LKLIENRLSLTSKLKIKLFVVILGENLQLNYLGIKKIFTNTCLFSITSLLSFCTCRIQVSRRSDRSFKRGFLLTTCSIFSDQTTKTGSSESASRPSTSKSKPRPYNILYIKNCKINFKMKSDFVPLHLTFVSSDDGEKVISLDKITHRGKTKKTNNCIFFLYLVFYMFRQYCCYSF
jgi:hypothetical protein